jgi:hypothetical protein
VQLERKQIEGALSQKGFRLDERDHRFYFLYVDGLKTGIYTYVSTGPKYKTIQAPLIAKMARELRLTKSEFADLVQCPMDGPSYVAKLRELGLRV